ncbi:hypothetical protein C8Q80DRAFT_608916 [Daedaleopsis nitida]|nr:hypothetical protein C8Q80DRAFT_608916 [Daedaleopsis nitida]
MGRRHHVNTKIRGLLELAMVLMWFFFHHLAIIHHDWLGWPSLRQRLIRRQKDSTLSSTLFFFAVFDLQVVLCANACCETVMVAHICAGTSLDPRSRTPEQLKRSAAVSWLLSNLGDDFRPAFCPFSTWVPHTHRRNLGKTNDRLLRINWAEMPVLT